MKTTYRGLRTPAHAEGRSTTTRALILAGPDHHDDAAALAALLRGLALRTRVLEDAETLLRACWRDMPELVLVPAGRQDDDDAGAAVVRRLRALPGGECCVILAYAAAAEPERISRMILAGATEGIVLPATPEELRRRLRQAGLDPAAAVASGA